MQRTADRQLNDTVIRQRKMLLESANLTELLTFRGGAELVKPDGSVSYESDASQTRPPRERRPIITACTGSSTGLCI